MQQQKRRKESKDPAQEDNVPSGMIAQIGVAQADITGKVDTTISLCHEHMVSEASITGSIHQIRYVEFLMLVH